MSRIGAENYLVRCGLTPTGAAAVVAQFIGAESQCIPPDVDVEALARAITDAKCFELVIPKPMGDIIDQVRKPEDKKEMPQFLAIALVLLVLCVFVSIASVPSQQDMDQMTKHIQKQAQVEKWAHWFQGK
jgi:hypothetical protein